MREAIGGAAIFNVVIVIIVFFNAYLAISVNYSKAYRVKNQIISVIEQHEGFDNGTQADIATYLRQVGYSDIGVAGTGCVNGYCVKEITSAMTGREGSKMYRVTTYMAVDIPLLGSIFRIPINGETKMIYDF